MIKWSLLIILASSSMATLWLLLSGQVHLGGDFRTADRSSAHIAPIAAANPEAMIQVYAARAFDWRGIFATHTWIAVKPAGAKQYTVLEVIGWRLYQGLEPLTIHQDFPDRFWYGNPPNLIFNLQGKGAAELIPKIMLAAESYPYKMQYHYWPGPNSNTFTAYVIRQVPELKVALPSNAIGKDFLPNSQLFASAPSGTGYQISLYGIVGILLAKEEGLEINVLGFVFGINPWKLFIDWPMVGKIGL